MEARKENKVYTITEIQKDRYLKEGFDIYDENGNIIEYTPRKTIGYNEHIKKMKELVSEKDKEISSLKTELEGRKKTTAENVMDLLKGYAKEKSIDVGASTSASGILTKILEAEKE